MKIFDKRPLSLILCIMLAVFVIFASVDKDYAIYTAAIALLIFIFSFITPRLFVGSRAAIRIAAIMIIPTIFISTVYFNYYFKADKRFANETVTVEGYVYEIDKSYSTTTDLALIRAENINGEPMSKYSLVAYLTKEESQKMTSGAELTVMGKLSAFSSDTSSWYGKGYSAILTDVANVNVTGYRELTLSNVISEYRGALTRYIVLKSEDMYSGGLFAALLTGEQSYLEPGLKTDFKMIGISHILALSGMHLAIICMGLGRLLDAFGMNRKLRCVFVILFTILYMAFTGFSSSVTRSGIMLILSSILYLLSRTHDSVTSLFLAVTLIIIIEPYAIFDLSLWLSAFATLGVLTAYDGYSEYDKLKPVAIRFLRYVAMSLLASLFAICATILLSDMYFGRISIIAPFSALIFGILCEAYMYLGIAMLLITVFWSGIAILEPLYEIIANLSEFLSGIDYVYTYTSFPTVKIMILILTLALLLFLVLNIDRKAIAAFVLTGMLITVYTTSYFMTKYHIPDDILMYQSKDGADTFICESNGKICVIDSRTYSVNQAYKSQSLIENMAICQIDTYILPVYYWRAADMLSVLFNTTKIDTIAIPSPQNELEQEVLENIKVICDEYKTKLEILENDKKTTVGDFSFIPIYRTPYGDKTQSYVYTMLIGDKFYTYISSGFLETDYKEHAEKVFVGSNTLILGEHGKKYTDEFIFRYQIPGLKTLIMNSDNLTLNRYSTDFYISENTKILYDISDLYPLNID